ncbi:MAG: metal-dependent hydrolase [Sulfurovaceae bacterium]|nr:metal-dependent hydrolase [Sulfurovaceae bacterium]
MNIIEADYIYIQGEYINRKAIAFDKTIKAIDTKENLLALYPDATIHTTPPNSVIYPGFINTHVHIEFSSNKTTLTYGSFIKWLSSVMTNASKTSSCDNSAMENACNEMLKSGITGFGAISSYGVDLNVCINTPQRVVYFNEIVGSNEGMIDINYESFEYRTKLSQKYASDNFIPAVSIHSAYSTHKTLINKAISYAKENKLLLTAHLLESPGEREWLTNASGDFYEFYKNFIGVEKPANTLDEFLKAFDDTPTHFIHCVQATKKELDMLKVKGHSIAHCPRSNRMLGCGRLSIEDVKAPFSVATDGLSSNWSLNIFDELRAALMMHYHIPLHELSVQLINSVTSIPAKIFGLNCGIIAPQKLSDFCIITLPDTPVSLEEIALWTILHTKEATKVYIGGKQYV